MKFPLKMGVVCSVHAIELNAIESITSASIYSQSERRRHNHSKVSDTGLSSCHPI